LTDMSDAPSPDQLEEIGLCQGIRQNGDSACLADTKHKAIGSKNPSPRRSARN
jgi:hypothetical protein